MNPVFYQNMPFSFQNPDASLFAGYTTFLTEFKGRYARDLISALDDTVQFLMGGRYDWVEVGSAVATVNSATAAEAEFTSALDKAFSPRIGFVYQTVHWLSLYDNYTKLLSFPGERRRLVRGPSEERILVDNWA